MLDQSNEEKILLPHHKQLSLCTTRLPYRQGRRLTAVKVYSISKESNHLLIFGVPSLNLRQEAKALMLKFGKLLQFNISKEHASETFTETYHAQYERIQSARHAKRMVDTKNFYGGLLHVCYAPELENIEETKQKLMQRQCDIIFRLKNLKNEQNNSKSAMSVTNNYESKQNCEEINPKTKEIIINDSIKLNMGVINTISIGNEANKVTRKRKLPENKKFLPCFIDDRNDNKKRNNVITDHNNATEIKYNNHKLGESNITFDNITDINSIEVIDCTSVEEEVITNINEHLNYNNFGNEVIKKIPQKPVNKIQFHFNKNS